MDPPTRPGISQKDYLKKYFSKNKTDKKKNKKLKLSSSSHLKRSQIIDDDLNLNSIADIDDDNFNLSYLGDEAPQIAGIVDERPDHLRALEVYGDKKKWKSVGEEPGGSMNAYSSNTYNDIKIKENNQTKNELLISNADKNLVEIMVKKEKDVIEKNGDYYKQDKDRNSLASRKLERNKRGDHREPFSPGNKCNDLDSNQSPPRKHSGKDDRRTKNDSESDESPPRRNPGKDGKRQGQGSYSNQSPPRKKSGNDIRRPRNNSDSDNSPPRRNPGKDNKRPRNNSDSDNSPPRRNPGKDNRRPRNNSDSDNSPPRRNPGKDNKRPRNNSDSDNSPPRRNPGKDNRRPRNGSDSDNSPPRRNPGKDNRRPRNNSDSDNSPPRRNPGKDNRRPRNGSDSDNSPPRRNSGKDNRRPRNGSDSDQSPPRRNPGKDSSRPRNKSDSDQSPPRRNLEKDDRRWRKDQSPPRRNFMRDDRRPRKDGDSDLSPPRRGPGKDDKRQRKGSDSDQSPPRRNTVKNVMHRRGFNSNQSPPRKPTNYRRNSDSDQSPPRKPISKNNRWEGGGSNRNYSPPRKNFSNKSSDYERNEKYKERNRNISPGRKDLRMKDTNDKNFKTNSSKEARAEGSDFKKNDFSKMEKTLDGKKAGLQNAKNLREELETLKEEEERMFKNMDSSRLGVGNETVVRDRRTGRIKDLVKEKEESKEKMQERLAREAKYSRWGKGLKQLEDASSKVADAIHEMSKPLARHKDDSDLDAYLKAQEREGDPMLDYIRQRQQESHKVEKLKPHYEGSYGPNRFNIRPGHRWDGVDRSNGYEAKWFASINAKKAIQEEAYKWSSADM